MQRPTGGSGQGSGQGGVVVCRSEMVAKGPSKASPEVWLPSQGEVKAMGAGPWLPAVAATLMGYIMHR